LANTESRSRLGKGLGALLEEYLDEPDLASAPVRELELVSIRPNPFQPRQGLAETGLDELAASIRENGLLQPLVVRPAEPGWELVAGERRWRVLQRMGWEKAPSIVRELSDEQMLVLALVENLQREDLGPLEEAVGYQQLISRFGLKQSEVAKRVGRQRSTVANALRLLTLPEPVRDLLSSGGITAGHARAILAVDGERRQIELAKEVAARGLSVRETERRARQAKRRTADGKPALGGKRPVDPVARRAETLFARRFGTDVHVSLRGKTKGHIRIPFRDEEDFERVTRLLLDEAEGRELFEGR
jgi:ParB family chromosome partitioning protein